MNKVRAISIAGVAGLALGLGGCGLGPLSAPPPPPAATFAPPAPNVPTVDIAAAPDVVRDVLVKRARARGSAPTLTASAVVIERQLPSTNETLAAACGPHVPGRAVRVVLGTDAMPTGTRVTEQRYIVDGSRICPIPMTDADMAQSRASLGEVKTQAEQRVAGR